MPWLLISPRAARKGAQPGAWLERMRRRKPPMLVRVALGNKMARTAWALFAHGEYIELRSQSHEAAVIVSLEA